MKKKKRFSGYDFKSINFCKDGKAPYMAILDETGASYLVVPPHPEFSSSQPYVWRQKSTSFSILGRIL